MFISMFEAADDSYEISHPQKFFDNNREFCESLIVGHVSGFGDLDLHDLAGEFARLSGEEGEVQDTEREAFCDSWDYSGYENVSEYLNYYIEKGVPYLPCEFEGISQNQWLCYLERLNGWEYFSLTKSVLADIHKMADDLPSED